MNNDKGMISHYQSALLYILIFFSPCIRYLPSYTAIEAGPAAWISVFWAIGLGTFLLISWNAIMTKYRFISYIDILKDIFGKAIGSIFAIILFFWLTIIISYYARIFAERILSSATTDINIVLLISILLFIAIFVLSKGGLVTIARMNEVFFILVISIFIIAAFLLFNQIKIENLYPITYKDIYPSFKGSFGMLSLWSYITVLFIYYDKVIVSDNYKKLNFKLLVFLTLISLVIVVLPLGLFGSEVLTKMPTPFLSSIMQISFMNTIERFDLAIVIIWIINDFILTTIFIYSALHIIKVQFKIEDTKPFLVIYSLCLFLLSLILISSSVEIIPLSHNILTPLNLMVGAFLPVLTFIVGKIRKKL